MNAWRIVKHVKNCADARQKKSRITRTAFFDVFFIRAKKRFRFDSTRAWRIASAAEIGKRVFATNYTNFHELERFRIKLKHQGRAVSPKPPRRARSARPTMFQLEPETL